MIIIHPPPTTPPPPVHLEGREGGGREGEMGRVNLEGEGILAQRGEYYPGTKFPQGDIYPGPYFPRGEFRTGGKSDRYTGIF